MRRLVGCLLLCHFSFSLCAQSGKVDSVSSLIEAHPLEDTIKVNLLNELSYQNIGVNYFSARKYAEDALHLSEKLSYINGIVDSNNRLAVASWSLGENNQAIQYALKAIAIIEKENLENARRVESYRALGFAYLDLNEVKKAEFYFRGAEKIGLQTKNWNLLFRIYIGLARVKYFQDQLDSARFFFEKCEHVLAEHPHSFDAALLKYFKAVENKDTNLAIRDLTETLNFSKSVGNKYVETMSLIMLGANFYQKNNYPEAEKYLLSALKLSRAIGIKNLTSQDYMLLIDLKKSQGKFEEAMSYQKAFYELNDSIFNGSKTREVIELETRYEKEKQQQEIELLVQQKRADTILKFSLLTGLCIVIISSVVIYKLQQSSAKRARELLTLQKSINEKLKETDNLKSRFFANISHEFRTPLTLIISPLEEKLRSAVLSDEDKELFERVTRNSNQLLGLVNEMLDLSKLEAKKMELRVQLSDLRAFIVLLTASFDSVAESRKIKFEKRIDLVNNEQWFDKEKIERIINNLLFNAFKFTPVNGNVSLSVDQVDHGSINITVRDNGKGISPEDQSHVFTSFYQAQNILDGEPSGTGLGLSLVKELVSLYNGTIKLESTVGKGTTISITLPVTKEKLSHAQFVEPKMEINLARNPMLSDPIHEEGSDEVNDENNTDQILIVEDNADLRNFIASTMGVSYSVMTARDGEEGWKMATEHIPDIIISDVMIPKFDGIELAGKIKNDERTSHIPIVLLTAKADLETRLKGLKTGADDYLLKPFSTEELFIRVANLVEQRKKLIAKFRAELVAPSPSQAPFHQPSLDEKFMEKALKIIQENIGNNTFGVNDFADAMNLSRAQLFRKLKAIIGQSPNEIINDIRLQRAAEMILADVDTLAQISYTVGFNEPSYFAKRFKKKFGVVPSEYRNEAKHQSEN